MSAQDLEQRARELLAAELEAEGDQSIAIKMRRGDAGMDYSFVAAIRAIVAALRQQPAPVDLEQFREAVEYWRVSVQQPRPHVTNERGHYERVERMAEADRLLALIDNAGKLCPCGEATCTESWEPGCGLGESVEHAVPAEREPPRGDELRAILAHQPAPVVDDAMREDAERYRFIRDSTPEQFDQFETGLYAGGDELNAYIDAAIARAQGVQS